MSILVTGGAGFVGSHFIEMLIAQDDRQIVCLDNFNDFYSPQQKRANIALFQTNARVTIEEADFCDHNNTAAIFAKHGVTHVVHLGAYAGVRYSVENPKPYQEVNVGGTLSLLEAARNHPVQRFLIASSSTVYGRDAGIPFEEDAPLGTPMSPYGATKRAAELMGFTYRDLFGVPVACLRPFSVYGPRLRPDLAMTIFARAILNGDSIPLYGDGSIRRDFTHVSDICAGFYAAIDAPDIEGKAINLGHSDPIAMQKLLHLLQEAAGKEAVIDQRPTRAEDLPVTFADLQRAGELLQYAPKVRIEDGVQEFVDWCRATQ